MTKLYRKETAKYFYGLSTLTESSFIEEISRAVRMFRKREDLYQKLINEYTRSSFLVPQMIIDLETGANEGNKTIEKISAFRKESFFKCKTYLYTVFMRISEMLEMSRQKAWSLNLLECQREIYYVRKALSYLYNNLAFFQKYDVAELLDFFKKNQHQRILKLLPRKRLISLTPLRKTSKETYNLKTIYISNEKLNSSHSNHVGVPPAKVVRELSSLKILATEKRIEYRRINKNKNLFRLYNILEIKAIICDNSTAFVASLEENIRLRNQLVCYERKKWEKRCLKKTNKLSKEDEQVIW